MEVLEFPKPEKKMDVAEWMRKRADDISDLADEIEHVLMVQTFEDGSMAFFSAKPIRKDMATGIFQMASLSAALQD